MKFYNSQINKSNKGSKDHINNMEKKVIISFCFFKKQEQREVLTKYIKLKAEIMVYGETLEK